MAGESMDDNGVLAVQSIGPWFSPFGWPSSMEFSNVCCVMFSLMERGTVPTSCGVFLKL